MGISLQKKYSVAEATGVRATSNIEVWSIHQEYLLAEKVTVQVSKAHELPAEAVLSIALIRRREWYDLVFQRIESVARDLSAFVKIDHGIDKSSVVIHQSKRDNVRTLLADYRLSEHNYERLTVRDAQCAVLEFIQRAGGAACWTDVTRNDDLAAECFPLDCSLRQVLEDLCTRGLVQRVKRKQDAPLLIVTELGKVLLASHPQPR
jgi:hypothetical protein